MAKERIEHQEIVKALIDYFQSQGLKIHSANYPDYPHPIKIKRHTPDVLALDPKTGLGYIGEAKMCDELSSQTTKEQFEDFPKRIMKNGKSEGVHLPFFIGLPQECISKIKPTFMDFKIPWRENIHPMGF